LTPEGIIGVRKGVVNKFKAIQGKYLRIITGAYKATVIEALEIETHILLIDIALETITAKTMLRLGTSAANSEVEKTIKRIRQQMRLRRGKQVRIRKTLGQKKCNVLGSLGWLESVDWSYLTILGLCVCYVLLPLSSRTQRKIIPSFRTSPVKA
jgi:hypothetical protein